MYVASAPPIKEVYLNDYTKNGEEVEYFIINPIIKETIFGCKIVGGVEAISKVKLFDCYFSSCDDYGPVGCYFFTDAKSGKREVGAPSWNANFDLSVNKILKKEAIDKYFSQTPEEMIQIINKMREEYRESVKGNELSRAFK